MTSVKAAEPPTPEALGASSWVLLGLRGPGSRLCAACCLVQGLVPRADQAQDVSAAAGARDEPVGLVPRVRRAALPRRWAPGRKGCGR